MAKRRRTRWITNATGRRGERRSARSRQRAVGTVREPRLGGRRVAPRASDATRRAEAGLERPVRRPGGVSARPEPIVRLRCFARNDARTRTCRRGNSWRRRETSSRVFRARMTMKCARRPALGRTRHARRAPQKRSVRVPAEPCQHFSLEGLGRPLARRQYDKCRQMRLSVITTQKNAVERGLFFRSPPPDGVSPPKTTRQPRRRRKPNQKPRRNRTLHPAPPTPAGRIRSPRRRRR